MSSSASASHLLITPHPPVIQAPRQTVEELFTAYEHTVFTRGNRHFTWLLLIQWAFAIAVAVLWSPRTWSGTTSWWRGRFA